MLVWGLGRFGSRLDRGPRSGCGVPRTWLVSLTVTSGSGNRDESFYFIFYSFSYTSLEILILTVGLRSPYFRGDLDGLDRGRGPRGDPRWVGQGSVDSLTVTSGGQSRDESF